MTLLGSATNVKYTMYDYRLNTNMLKSEAMLPANCHSEPQQYSTYFREGPLSMSNSDLRTLDYRVMAQAGRAMEDIAMS